MWQEARNKSNRRVMVRALGISHHLHMLCVEAQTMLKDSRELRHLNFAGVVCSMPRAVLPFGGG